MKTVVYRNVRVCNDPIPFPNAMPRSEVLHRFLDGALAAASGMGLAAALLLLFVML